MHMEQHLASLFNHPELWPGIISSILVALFTILKILTYFHPVNRLKRKADKAAYQLHKKEKEALKLQKIAEKEANKVLKSNIDYVAPTNNNSNDGVQLNRKGDTVTLSFKVDKNVESIENHLTDAYLKANNIIANDKK